MSHPKLQLKLELTIPGDKDELPKKFSVNRTLKAKWTENSDDVTKQVLEEIKNYRGSFVGDLASCLKVVVESNETFKGEEHERESDVLHWFVSVVEAALMQCINDGTIDELIQNEHYFDWDGTMKIVEKVSTKELKNIDIEKVGILLNPRIKNVIHLVSKKLMLQQ